MLNIVAIILTLLSIFYYVIIKKKSLIDFRVFVLIYYLFFYEASFFTFYIIESKIPYETIESIGLANFIFIFSFLFISIITKTLPVGENYFIKNEYIYNSNRIITTVISIFLFVLIILYIYYIRVGSFPLFSTNIEQTRIDAAGRASGFVIILMQFVFVFFVISTAYFLQKRKYFVVFLILCFSIGYWVLLTPKRPLAGLLLMFIIIYNIIVKKISNRTLLFSILFMLVILVFYGAFRLFNNIDTVNVLLIFQGLFHAEMFNLSLIFNDPPPIMYGSSYLNSILMIFTDVKDIGTELKDYYGLAFSGGGITIGIIGEGYLNFRWTGVFLECLLFWRIIFLLSKSTESCYYSLNYIKIARAAYYFYMMLWVLRNGFLSSIVILFYFIIFEFIIFYIKRYIYVKKNSSDSVL